MELEVVTADVTAIDAHADPGVVEIALECRTLRQQKSKPLRWRVDIHCDLAEMSS